MAVIPIAIRGVCYGAAGYGQQPREVCPMYPSRSCTRRPETARDRWRQNELLREEEDVVSNAKRPRKKKELKKGTCWKDFSHDLKGKAEHFKYFVVEYIF